MTDKTERDVRMTTFVREVSELFLETYPDEEDVTFILQVSDNDIEANLLAGNGCSVCNSMQLMGAVQKLQLPHADDCARKDMIPKNQLN
jgi:hypothetical protein